MTLCIETIRAATDAEWDSIARDCAYATGFHSRDWARAWAEATRGRLEPAPRMVQFSDHTRVLLPLSIEHRRGTLPKRFVSSPAGTYGGWVSGEQLTSSHASLLAEFMSSDLSDLVWRTNPFDPLACDTLLPGSIREATYVLPLCDGFDSLCDRWASTGNATLRKARKAERAGVTVRQASSIDDWRAYFAIYEQTLTRWGSEAPSPYDWPMFEHFAGCSDATISLWLAEHDARPIAGAVCVHSHVHCSYWHGAAATDALHLRPVNLLHVEIIRAMCERRIHWYDFNPSGGHAGVERFKRSFGCDVLTTNVILTQSLRTRATLKLPRLLRRAS